MLKLRTWHAMGLCLAAYGCEKTTVEGPGNRSLTLVKPAETTIERGGTAEVDITLTRENFSGPVTVDFADLPSGVSVVDETREIADNKRTFVLKASETADLVANHAARVSVRGPEGMTATEELRLTVREKD